MYEANHSFTLPVRPCCACRAVLLESSNFCRSCGARQPIQSELKSTTGNLPGETSVPASIGQLETRRVSQPILYHPVSGPLVRAVAAGVPAALSGSPAREFPKRMLLALMAIPIWLMIILLSPIDAYTSAKIIGNRI
ncbi:MAG TPA: hypothetical protein VLR92_07740 [Blastocatellia bacterium]|nr:hypothetical protein [Blastocatellia bacterium]